MYVCVSECLSVCVCVCVSVSVSVCVSVCAKTCIMVRESELESVRSKGRRLILDVHVCHPSLPFISLFHS